MSRRLLILSEWVYKVTIDVIVLSSRQLSKVTVGKIFEGPHNIFYKVPIGIRKAHITENDRIEGECGT